MKPENIRVCVLRIEGTNCEDEMADAFRAVGTQAEKVPETAGRRGVPGYEEES